ncbi:AroM family protein [Terribacillus saccharophilus]|uniref:aspartate/glutamate racemase family protein n=1 Tax=Terribacillus saccharophilus TaxID=361277 RepID=UPI00398235FF
MIGVIRVFSSEDKEVVELHGKLIQKRFGSETRTACIPDQPKGIHDDETERIAVPKIVQKGIELAEAGCKAILISCAADPALEELRAKVSLPVIGAGSAAALTAKALGKPVGVMGITETIPPAVEGQIADMITGYRRPDGVTNTTDLLTEEGKQRGIQAAKDLIGNGAEVIVFACTGFATIGLKKVLEQELAVPVIDAVEAGGRFAVLV